MVPDSKVPGPVHAAHMISQVLATHEHDALGIQSRYMIRQTRTH